MGPFTSFAKDATSAPLGSYYDYIIVGVGTAGCALAATLSVSAKVLLLERGGLPYDHPNVTHIIGFPATLADTSPVSASQFFVSTDGVFNHRGSVLGSNSAINAGFFTRASREYMREVGWEPRLVNESYEWVEKKVAFRPRVLAWQAAVREGLREAGVLPYKGHRHTVADSLEYAEPTRITIYLRAMAQQIFFRTLPGGQKPKAFGVFFKDFDGIKHLAYLNSEPTSEVILCAGALGSPQLLMLSGIGPANHLRANGIRVILNQPVVGQGMSDNPMNVVMVPLTRPLEISLIEAIGITNVGSYIEAASGFIISFVWASLYHEYTLVLDSKKLKSLQPLALYYLTLNSFNFLILAGRKKNFTIQPWTMLTNLTLPETAVGSALFQNPDIQAGIILEKVMGPFSKGYLELQSNDPNDNPKIICVEGMEIIRKVVESQPLSTFRYPFTSFQSLMNLMLSVPINLRRKHLTASYSLEKFYMDTVMTIWHYHGGCQVNKVVDHDYKVLGVDALQVVDGSTFYNSLGTNPQATVMMLGRYVG
ncbi:Glucose dehydrogenase/choline dehydrogenase/mandelonitrile lyase (GMC oxidoreductase family) [Handroanthus impetiginosus]|uniref:Glucose dehydrogenase/choline dehydrogenase/mandelonitrile lyase (GMC oxidoreductase family) n=1 Tax=Handroanthus impetiginosus TaxID=429701 RepID=A0A2G9IAM7_9LAMI|nr:Glucose dehydrogenase/choline dehydrogenase/mandelonitrile lyase (GMC oxidoreductase family) [Handroanthus impetiginosus]